MALKLKGMLKMGIGIASAVLVWGCGNNEREKQETMDRYSSSEAALCEKSGQLSRLNRDVKAWEIEKLQLEANRRMMLARRFYSIPRRIMDMEEIIADSIPFLNYPTPRIKFDNFVYSEAKRQLESLRESLPGLKSFYAFSQDLESREFDLIWFIAKNDQELVKADKVRTMVKYLRNPERRPISLLTESHYYKIKIKSTDSDNDSRYETLNVGESTFLRFNIGERVHSNDSLDFSGLSGFRSHYVIEKADDAHYMLFYGEDRNKVLNEEIYYGLIKLAKKVGVEVKVEAVQGRSKKNVSFKETVPIEAISLVGCF